MSLIGRELLEEGLINLERWFFLRRAFLGEGLFEGAYFRGCLYKKELL